MPTPDSALSALSRRDFARRLAAAGLTLASPTTLARLVGAENPIADTTGAPAVAVGFPGPWAFNLPKGAIILISDAQLEALEDPDREVDVSLSATPQLTTLRKLCQEQQARGARTVILAFDQFFAQYRPGQAGPRRLLPDTDEYIQKVARLGETLKAHGLGFELSLLSPLELGVGYARATGESGGWVQYREGLRDPRTGHYEVSLWEHLRWTNNKGSIEVKRVRVRAFAFRERPLGGSPYHVVDPREIVELAPPARLEPWEGARHDAGSSFSARRLTVAGAGDTQLEGYDRVLVVVAYQTPEIDYFSPRARPFLEDLVGRYHRAGVPLHGLYADEMHIQQDWVYHTHHDEGQFTLRFLTPSLARAYAAAYGDAYADFEKYLVYFCYAQHSFLPGLEARQAAQHVLGPSPEEIQRTALLRRRYYDLLSRTVIGLFAQAKAHAESLYGHELEARAHATWAQSPTIDRWETGPLPHAPRQYEYTPDFLWSNTVHQAASVCDDYFRWNEFLTGGGNDHTEGGWSDRNYYALALACSTGILNRVPYAYAAHWGMPAAAAERRQALVDAYGAAASPPFQALEDSQHRDIEVLMLYPLSLVATEERFGSWMTQYGYANYVTPDVLLARGRVVEGGRIEMAGRSFTTVVVLFEPLPPAGLLPFLDPFVRGGGRLIWSGPPPRLDLAGQEVLPAWQSLCGVKALGFTRQGLPAAGETVRFAGPLAAVPPQTLLTPWLIDHVYPVQPADGAEAVATLGGRVVGTQRRVDHGSVTFLGFRPRDDQAASLGEETRGWFETLRALGAYPPSRAGLPRNDNPSVVSRETSYLACRFPNGTTTVAPHYRHHVESWPGGFHRDAEQDQAALAANPPPSDRLELEEFLVNGHAVTYRGRRVLGFRLDAQRRLIAFGGHDCASLRLDGRDHTFASQPFPRVVWTPVAAERRVPGGARVELWVDGEGELRVPLPEPVSGAEVRLFAAGARPGSLGQELPVAVRDGVAILSVRRDWPGRHLYLI